MTLEELAGHDGREGRRALVAVNGKVYDFTNSPLWREGNHEDRHRAGRDLSEELKGAPHVRAVIERFPVFDTLREKPESRPGSRAPLFLVGLGIAALLILLLLFLI